jgi:hypothetical protein
LADKLKKYIHHHLKKGHHPDYVRKHVEGYGHHPGVVQGHIRSYYRKRTILLAVTILVLIAVVAGIFFAAQRYGKSDVPYLELHRSTYFPLVSPVEKIGLTSDDQFLFILDTDGRQTQYQVSDSGITTLAVAFPETSIPVGTFEDTETGALKCKIEDGRIMLLHKPGDKLVRTLKSETYERCFFSFSESRLFVVSESFVSIYDLNIIEP